MHFRLHNYSQDGERHQIPGYQTDILTDKAVDMLRNRKQDTPFFLSVGYLGTHSPWRGHPERIVSQYRNCTFDEIPRYPMHSDQTDGYKQHSGDRETLAQYFAAVTHIDQGVGRILDELEAQDVRENTLVIYTSDHGLNLGHHGIFSKGNGTCPKNMHEGSIRVPLVFNWPEGVGSQGAMNQIVDHTDLFLTIPDLAGVDPPDDPRLGTVVGHSYAPLLHGEEMDWENVYFGEYGQVRCIRTDTCKYVYRYSHPDTAELYDCEDDPEERNNLVFSDMGSEIAESLHKRMEERFAEIDVCGRSGLDQPYDLNGQLRRPKP